MTDELDDLRALARELLDAVDGYCNRGRPRVLDAMAGPSPAELRLARARRRLEDALTVPDRR